MTSKSNQQLDQSPALLTKLPRNPEIDINAPASWSQVKHWAGLAANFAHASVASQVMAGFGLIEMRKQFNSQGKRADLATSPHDVAKLGWQETVEKEVGISDETARRWIAMAEGIKARWKKLAPQKRLMELMSVSPNQWTDDDTKLITDSLHKVADGSTQLEFMRELGLAKLPQGAGATGGKGGAKKKLNLAEEAELRTIQARMEWAAIEQGLKVYTDKFLLLTDAEITAQLSLPEVAIAARNAWLKQPLDRRDPAAISILFKK